HAEVCGMNPENAAIASGRGRPAPSPNAYDITAPCENPASHTLSYGSESSHAATVSYVGANVAGSGEPTWYTAYQCAPPGGSDSDSPSVSNGSSAVKPGPIVAISNSTPLGSRK